jgi:DNA-binding beta-propeller fold protein YncE
MMKVRHILLAAASGAAMVNPVPSAAAPAGKPPVDANGVPCVDGKLDGALQCIPNSIASGSANHPYREAGVSDPRLHVAARLGSGFQTTAKKLVYAAVPGSVLIFDTRGDFNDKFTFVKRIVFEDAPAPIGPESISAIMADPATNMIYVSTRGSLYAIDLLREKVVWKNRYEEGTCCERGAVTPDGKTLVVGSDLKNFHYVLDARTGAVKGKIPTPMSMFNHNMNLSADGRIDFAAPNGITMTIADVPSMKPIKTITFSDHIRVFVINHDATKIYANLNNLLGFEIADVKSGKVVKRVEAPAEMWKAKWADPNATYYGHGAPMHGIAMLPDESEIWIPDAMNNQVLVYDNDGDTPRLNMSKSFKTNGQPNGWITFGLDGKLAYMASGDVVDVASHKVIAQLKDEYGRYFNSEKMLEMAFDPNGHLSRTVNQFSNGLPEAYAERHGSSSAASHAGK